MTRLRPAVSQRAPGRICVGALESDKARRKSSKIRKESTQRSEAGVREERDRSRHRKGCERCHLREAHRLYTEMGAVGHAERVGRELGSIE